MNEKREGSRKKRENESGMQEDGCGVGMIVKRRRYGRSDV
jgi:hypothetical protein